MSDENSGIQDVGLVLLQIGADLMSSGASTARVRTTLNRISETFGYRTELFITNRALMLTVHSPDSPEYFSSVKRTSPHGINFKLVSGISRMSWSVVEERWSVERIREEVARLESLPHYPRWLVIPLIGLAGSAFCRQFGGHAVEMIVSFLATSAGLYVRQEAHRRKFNSYFCVYLAATSASLLSGAAVKFNIGISPELAFTTSVLFLIPGVPLINCISDLLDGNILNGLSRGVIGLLFSLAIALGLITAMIILSVHVWNGF